VGSIVENGLICRAKLLEINPTLQKILLCSSDIPLITPAIIRDFIEECGSQTADVYYAIVAEQTMESQFPNSKRTYIPFQDGRYTGGDAFLVRADLELDFEFLEGITGSRKNYFKQIKMFGIGSIIRFLLRRMSVQQVAVEVAMRIGIAGQVVITRHAELAMDLDKPHHYELIKAELENKTSE
jgi:hypothetical protein